MLNASKTRKKRQPFTEMTVNNVKMVVTLSDRLKQAGIKECGPKCETQTNVNSIKNSRKRKNFMKKSYSEKYIDRDLKSSITGKKQLRKLPKYFLLTHAKDFNPNEEYGGEIKPKNSMGFPQHMDKNIKGSAKETIFVSLDFIKDCQQYKKKFRNPNGDSESRNQHKNVSDNRTSFTDNRKTSQKVLERNEVDSKGSSKEEKYNSNGSLEKNTENPKAKQDPLYLETEINTKETTNTDDFHIREPKGLAETFSQVKPFLDRLPSDDVAKIDKKYLQSLLSIATNKDTKDKINMTEKGRKECQETRNEWQRDKKKMITGKVSLKNEIITKNSNKKYFEKIEDVTDTITNVQNLSERNPVSPCTGLTAARVRDFTKSEVQVQLRKGRNFLIQRDSEMKSDKDVAYSKPQENFTRRKRKLRNQNLKSSNKDYLDKTFANEVPRVVDVKELWRRETRKNSDNSLSSQSSSTTPENDDVPEWKNLELKSYNILKKLVEKEIEKISKTLDNENNTSKVRNDSNADKFTNIHKNESEKTKNVCTPLRIRLPKNSRELLHLNQMNANIFKRRQIQAGNQYPSTYEGEKPKSELLALLIEDKLQDSKANLKLLQEKEKKKGKIPNELIKNWSILNRLEQAFLALGTPNFPNKSTKDFRTLKTKNTTVNEKTTAPVDRIKEEHLDDKIKKSQNSKQEVIKKDNKNNKTSLETKPVRRNKKLLNDNIRSNSKDKPEEMKLKKNDKSLTSAVPEKVLQSKENSVKQQKQKTPTQTLRGTPLKKTNLRSSSKSKITENESRPSKKQMQSTKFPSGSLLPKPTKVNDFCKKKSLRVLVHNKNSEKTLERKKTFDIIQSKESSLVEPRKSKSCNKIDEVNEEEKKHFTRTKKQGVKDKNSVDENAEDELKLKSKSIPSNTENKTNSIIPKMVLKTKIKEKPSNEKRDGITEKEQVKVVTQESPAKTQKGRITEENKCKKTKPVEDLPQQILARKELNKNSTERAVKERSILSMRGNQQEPSTALEQMEENTACDFSPALKSQTGDLIVKEAQQKLNRLMEKPAEITTPTFSIPCLNAGTNDATNLNVQKCEVEATEMNEKSLLNITEKLTSSSLSSNTLDIQQSNEIAGFEVGTGDESKASRYQSLWERDILHYRAIVKEIMSQYKRLDGFLKQNGHALSVPDDDSANIMFASVVDDEPGHFSDRPKNINLQEYRKKIMSEYQALPIYEYKTRQKQDGNFRPEEPIKRNLSVVKDVSTNSDLDIKDYKPNIQKVLNSQLYVDVESLTKRNDLKVKFKEKKSSLQEIIPSKSEKPVKQEECSRSSSMPKAFLSLLGSRILFDSPEKPEAVGSKQSHLATA